MWHKVDGIIQPGWHLEDPSKGMILNIYNAITSDYADLREDMFRICSDDGRHMLAVGWWPDQSEQGRYRGGHAIDPYAVTRSEITTRDYAILTIWLSSIMKRINDAPKPYEGSA